MLETGTGVLQGRCSWQDRPFLLKWAVAVTFAVGVFASGTRLGSQSVTSPAAQIHAFTQEAPLTWAQAAAAHEEQIVNVDTANPLRYRVRRRDAKGEVVRQIIESKDGAVARVLERDGHPLSAAEDTEERDRLRDILASPDGFLRRVRRDQGSRAYAAELLHEMPHAMLWSYAAGQPQLPRIAHAVVVLDFTPDPKYRPPTIVTEGLTGIAGRIWIDPVSRSVLRIQGTILHPVDFGWGGVLARIKQGGSVELDQQQVSEHRWLYAHLVEHLSIREVLIHTVEENAEMWSADVQPLPHPIDYREAIQLLLAMPGAGH